MRHESRKQIDPLNRTYGCLSSLRYFYPSTTSLLCNTPTLSHSLYLSPASLLSKYLSSTTPAKPKIIIRVNITTVFKKCPVIA